MFLMVYWLFQRYVQLKMRFVGATLNADAHWYMKMRCALVYENEMRMRMRKWDARAHMKTTCACAYKNEMRIRIQKRYAHAQVKMRCAYASHFSMRKRISFYMRMRISFLYAHAHLISICAYASHFYAHAHLIFLCACVYHFYIRLRISFWGCASSKEFGFDILKVVKIFLQPHMRFEIWNFSKSSEIVLTFKREILARLLEI